MPPTRLHTMKTEQRRALRSWYSQQYPRPTQKACIEWFLQTYNHRLTQSTVSDSLSSRFASLDSPTSSISPTTQRRKAAAWPELEAALFDWQKRIDESGGITTGDILQEKAKQIWQLLPQYKEKPIPNFSIGWLDNFKKRYQIKSHIRHGEASSVSSTTEDEMKAIQTIAGDFKEEDIYNMDETGLFWRMTPSRGLSSQVRPGIKKDETRITVVVCTNATGSDRFRPWFIGKAKAPRALRNVNISTMGGEWRWNKKAWMNQYIMMEWLQAFYLHIGSSRSVLLTMDNFPGHTAAIENAPPPSNIRIIWLPANYTSRFQPLDQGIIASLKAHYRRQWLEFMLVSFENNNDPLDFMSLHLALRWIIRAWYHDVTNTTIYNCFRKSTIVTHPLQLPIEPLPSLNTLYSQVNNAGHIRDAMDLSNFLNPADESLQEGEYNGSNDDILQEVLAQYIQEDAQDEEEEQPEQPVYSMQDAQQALQVLIGYAESEDGVDTACLRSFERFERFLTVKGASLQAQGTLDQWIM